MAEDERNISDVASISSSIERHVTDEHQEIAALLWQAIWARMTPSRAEAIRRAFNDQVTLWAIEHAMIRYHSFIRQHWTRREVNQLVEQTETAAKELVRLQRKFADLSARMEMSEATAVHAYSAQVSAANASHHMDVLLGIAHGLRAAVPGSDRGGRGGGRAEQQRKERRRLVTHIAVVWVDAGLSLSEGLSGDGFDEFIEALMEASEGKAIGTGSRRWLEKLLTEVRRDVSPH